TITGLVKVLFSAQEVLDFGQGLEKLLNTGNVKAMRVVRRVCLVERRATLALLEEGLVVERAGVERDTVISNTILGRCRLLRREKRLVKLFAVTNSNDVNFGVRHTGNIGHCPE